jgi:hypothetical protein
MFMKKKFARAQRFTKRNMMMDMNILKMYTEDSARECHGNSFKIKNIKIDSLSRRDECMEIISHFHGCHASGAMIGR